MITPVVGRLNKNKQEPAATAKDIAAKLIIVNGTSRRGFYHNETRYKVIKSKFVIIQVLKKVTLLTHDMLL